MQVVYESGRKAESVDCTEYFFLYKTFSWNPLIIVLNKTVVDSYWLFFCESDGRSSFVHLSPGMSQVFCHPLVYIKVTEEG